MLKCGVRPSNLAACPDGVVRGHDRLEQATPVRNVFVFSWRRVQQVLAARLLHPETDRGLEGIAPEGGSSIESADSCLGNGRPTFGSWHHCRPLGGWHQMQCRTPNR
ncbi:hypothetical protein FQZ97_1137250 [compost metagenome]